jgi:hypothetical protein
MIDQNRYAIYFMGAIVITLYALKNSHTHYLPDLFGLAFALASKNQSYGIAAVVIMFIIRHSPLAYSVAGLLPEWLLPVALPGARYVSIPEPEVAAAEEAYKERISEDESDDGNTEDPQPVAENPEEMIFSAECRLMARAVLNGTLGLTEATQVVSKTKSGRKYQKYSRRIKIEMAELERKFADLDSKKNQIPNKTM